MSHFIRMIDQHFDIIDCWNSSFTITIKLRNFEIDNVAISHHKKKSQKFNYAT